MVDLGGDLENTWPPGFDKTRDAIAAALDEKDDDFKRILNEQAASLDEWFVKTKLPEYAIRAQDARDILNELKDIELTKASGDE